MHPIKELLLNAGYKLIDTGEYWRTTALYRGGHNQTSLSVNKKTGDWKDFSVNRWGNAEELARMIKGEAVSFENYVPEIIQEEKEEIVKTYPLESLKRLVPHFNLFLDRGISRETMKLFQAGLAHSNKLAKRICFPIFDEHGRIVGFAGRWFKDKHFDWIIKWKLIGRKTTWLYPVHLNDKIIREAREVIIVESIGDVLALWEAGFKHVICIFGTSISSKQLAYLMSIGAKRIIVATNNDVDNGEVGQLAAKSIAKVLEREFDKTEIVIHLPTAKDFGIMSPESIQQWYGQI